MGKPDAEAEGSGFVAKMQNRSVKKEKEKEKEKEWRSQIGEAEGETPTPLHHLQFALFMLTILSGIAWWEGWTRGASSWTLIWIPLALMFAWMCSIAMVDEKETIVDGAIDPSAPPPQHAMELHEVAIAMPLVILYYVFSMFSIGACCWFSIWLVISIFSGFTHPICTYNPNHPDYC